MLVGVSGAGLQAVGHSHQGQPIVISACGVSVGAQGGQEDAAGKPPSIVAFTPRAIL